MFSMRETLCCGAVAILFAFGAMAGDIKPTAASDVEYGKYLVENLGGCVDCHTPTLDNGSPDKTQWLKGAMLDFQPTHPIPHWKAMSPDITPNGPKWKKWGEAGFITFLETAKWPDRDTADPPMPAFHLHERDAKAIVAYLKTLK
jgi:mono/diheme cytochrome c family protein